MGIKETRIKQLIQQFKNQNIDLNTISYKTILIEFYSKKKINLCYEKLNKPKIEYVLITKEDKIIHINKTIYYYLKDIKKDLSSFIFKCKPAPHEMILYNRFKDSDYMNKNYLRDSEKQKIKRIELFFSGDYKKYIEVL